MARSEFRGYIFWYVLLSIVLTFMGKSRIEVAVKQILSGMNIKTNASVANPEALDWFREWAREDEQRLPN